MEAVQEGGVAASLERNLVTEPCDQATVEWWWGGSSFRGLGSRAYEETCRRILLWVCGRGLLMHVQRRAHRESEEHNHLGTNVASPAQSDHLYQSASSWVCAVLLGDDGISGGEQGDLEQGDGGEEGRSLGRR